MPPKRKADASAPSEPFHMSTRKRARTEDPANPADTAILPSPPPAPSVESSGKNGAGRRRGGARGATGTRGSSRGGRGHGGSAWRAWGRGGRKPENHGGRASDIAGAIALQYVDPNEKAEPPNEWVGPGRTALEARMEDLNEAYREVLASLKPALEELANRAQEKLKVDKDYHEQNAHYAKLKADLDERLQQELKLIKAKGKLKIEQEERRRNAEIASIESNYRAKVEGIRDDFVTHGKLDLMRTARRVYRNSEVPDEDKDLVDMENDRAKAKSKNGGANHLYHEGRGRGRFYNEVEAVWEDWQQRHADEPGTRHLPRPYKEMTRSKK